MFACTRCHVAKPADGFSTDSRKRSGLDSICKACRATLIRERRASGAPVVSDSPRALVRDAPVMSELRDGLGARRVALEIALEATVGALDPANAAAVNHVRNIADAMDRTDEGDERLAASGEVGPFGVEIAKLNPQYLVALREAGLTPGARKPKPAADEVPALKDVSSY